MHEFLTQNASAVFGLLGAIGGGVLSFIGSSLLLKRDFNLRLWDKLIERRIDAHEKLITIAIDMRSMVILGGLDEDGGPRRIPQVLFSADEFDNWFQRFGELGRAGTWHTIAAKREFHFVQDYLATLHSYSVLIPPENYTDLGEIVRQDFIDLSSSLEKCAFAFFTDKIRKLTLDSLDQWHKYEKSVTEERLKNTALMRNEKAVMALYS